jgi:hypothetical protein
VDADKELSRRRSRGLLRKKCGRNEKYVTCRSSSCFDETCKSVNSNSTRRCTKDCVDGCACAPDYVRDKDGSCYHKSRCTDEEDGEHRCGDNEVYVPIDSCRSSSCFDETCESINSDLPRICTKDCKDGCACVPDYVRDPDGRCYDKSSCDAVIGGILEMCH